MVESIALVASSVQLHLSRSYETRLELTGDEDTVPDNADIFRLPAVPALQSVLMSAPALPEAEMEMTERKRPLT